ncbi:hypothetical protein I6M74_21120 [Acinetobacter bereziniae]|uniref:hypothetical protein n=1 Tax=Acinetobacter bereziniae TaxID=106648 RepID=UPI00190287E5|nr:hypothetical protein [Acinetobacter bereziniae]MBJ8424377.1 hypothetical protein [Acinetobacter bereziniae]
MLFFNYTSYRVKDIALIFIKVLISFVIYFNSFSTAYAVGKNYNVKTIVYDPLEKVINATVLDQIAEKTMRRSAKVPVTASATGSTVASMIRMGIAGAAIYGLIEGVGWVIENGVVKKPVDNGQINTEYYWISNTTWSDGSQICKTPTKFSTGDPAVNEFKSCAIQNRLKDPSCAMNNFEQYKCKAYNQDGYILDWFTVDRIKNQNYDPNQTLVPVSDTELGEKVNNSPQAPQILPTVYNPNSTAGGTAPKITADAIDRAVPVPQTDPEGSTTVDPETGKGTFKLPAFCDWASVMCAWYEKYQDDSKKTDEHREKELSFWEYIKQEYADAKEKIKKAYDEIKDYFKEEEPEKEDTEVDIDDESEKVNKPQLSIGDDTCPSLPISLHIPFETIQTDISPIYICEIARGMKAFWIAFGLYTASLIVGRRN